MPFIALDKVTGTRIDITLIDHPRLNLKSGSCICQLCGEPMIIRAGSVYRPHFAHYSSIECRSKYQYHPESPEHRLGKIELAKLLREQFSEYTNANIEYEVPIPEIMRVADILITFPMGWRVAHEVQLAAITPEELEERTNDYNREGIDVFWWFGKSANTPSSRDWSIGKFGFSLCIEIDTRIEGEHYAIQPNY